MSRRLREGGCGRWLTDPESIARKFGKRCAERLGITPTRRPVRPARPRRPAVRPARPVDAPPEIHPDQTALDLIGHQPTLWSL